MGQNSTTADPDGKELFAGEAWFDPIEAGVRDRVRGFIEELLEQELTEALGRHRHERAADAPNGYRNGSRERRLLGSFGPVQINIPRARMAVGGGGTQEWRSAALPRYARMTRQVEALIAGAYLAGTNTRRVKRGLTAFFAGAVGKDVVSRTWGKVRTDWDAWNKRDLARDRWRASRDHAGADGLFARGDRSETSAANLATGKRRVDEKTCVRRHFRESQSRRFMIRLRSWMPL